MKISTEIASSSHIVGEEKAIEYVAKAGFDAWDFSMFAMCLYDWQNGGLKENHHPLVGKDYLKFARKLKKIGLDNGIVCNQSHAPFPTFIPEIRSYLKRAIECTAEAGGKICVVHPMNDASPAQNAELYWELLPFAKECGVKIATENMWDWDKEKDQASFAACCNAESFQAHFDAVQDDDFVACLDIGHAEMKGLGASAVELIHVLGDKLQALHLHDNDRWHDSHQLPLTMDIDYPAVVKALKEIGYQGYFTLESDRYLQNETADTVFGKLQEMANTARKLADMFENA